MTIINRNFILKILSLFFATSAWVAAEDSFQAQMYGVESGVLKSEIAVGYPGDKTIIYETLYWDNWGLKIAKYQIPESGKGGTKNIINYVYEAGKIRPGKMVLVKLDDMSTKETLTPASRIMSSFVNGGKRQQENRRNAFLAGENL